MQYKVPQNVQREDTIIGPVTLRQMIILGIGGGIAYATYISLAKTYFLEVWLPPVGIISALTLAIAFLKIHHMEFHVFLMNFIEYHLLPKKRIWLQGTGSPFISSLNTKKAKEKEAKVAVSDKNQRSLAELTTILDSHGKSGIAADDKEEVELSPEAKKENLNQMIEQNYKNKQ